MAETGSRLANLFLKFGTPLAGLRNVPVLGGFLRWASRILVPWDTLVWTQIQNGPAKGLWIRLNPRTGQNVQKGIGEPAVQQALVDHVKSGMTFYDLGANIGFFSLMAVRLVGPQGIVISFEADPEIAARLRENLTRNGFSHARVEEKAIWSEPTTVSFARVDPQTSPDRGLGHVSDSQSTPGTIIVPAVSLDSFVSSNPLPDFIKCDVEGAEVDVFAGAENVLATKRPILLVEMHSSENHQSLTENFQKRGYEIRALDENHVLALPK